MIEFLRPTGEGYGADYCCDWEFPDHYEDRVVDALNKLKRKAKQES